jgi:hypothetical protein
MEFHEPSRPRSRSRANSVISLDSNSSRVLLAAVEDMRRAGGSERSGVSAVAAIDLTEDDESHVAAVPESSSDSSSEDEVLVVKEKNPLERLPPPPTLVIPSKLAPVPAPTLSVPQPSSSASVKPRDDGGGGSHDPPRGSTGGCNYPPSGVGGGGAVTAMQFATSNSNSNSDSRGGSRSGSISGFSSSASLTGLQPQAVQQQNRQRSTSISMMPSSYGHQQTSSSNSADKWRNRLWPARALVSFARVITRCRPPAVTAGRPLGAVSLLSHWAGKDLKPVPGHFDNALAHSAAFFPLAVEEAREAATHSLLQPSHAGGREENDDCSTNGWYTGYVQSVLEESDTISSSSSGGTSSSRSDPKKGMVVTLRVRLFRFSDGSKDVSPSQAFTGGDLVAISLRDSSRNRGKVVAERPVLGLVSGWDPDYDSRYVFCFTINCSSFFSRCGVSTCLSLIHLLLRACML